MAKVIAVANQKGGCSKTSVVANLGIGLAMEGKKVAVIDADPQGRVNHFFYVIHLPLTQRHSTLTVA